MKTIHEKCGVKNYMKEDHRRYRRNFCSSKTRPEKRQASTGIKPLTSAIKVHFTTISTKKSTGKAL